MLPALPGGRAVIGSWLYHFAGLSGSGPVYGFWSGSGSDLSELAIVGAVIGGYRKHNCHWKGCWRIGRHLVDGSPWCDRHHQEARDAAASPDTESEAK